MAKSRLVEANEKIAEGAVSCYKRIEEGVVSGYKKIEDGVAGGFTKITDKFVDCFLTKEGESVEEAKKRLAEEQTAREAESNTAAKNRAAINADKNTGKQAQCPKISVVNSKTFRK